MKKIEAIIRPEKLNAVRVPWTRKGSQHDRHEVKARQTEGIASSGGWRLRVEFC